MENIDEFLYKLNEMDVVVLTLIQYMAKYLLLFLTINFCSKNGNSNVM